MAITVTVPELGEGVDAVEVVKVLVAIGDTVAKDQPLVEVETDKAAVEIPSTAAGVVTEVHAREGDSLTAGAAIISLDEASSQKGSPAPEAASADASPEPEVSAEQPAAETSSPPAPEPASSQAEPELQDTPPPRPASPPTSTPDEAPLAPRWVGHDGPRKLVPAAPSVRRFAREVGVDIEQVAGSGPGGRISQDDVKAHSRRLLDQLAQGAAGIAPRELPDLSAYGPIRREPMSKIRRLTAENLARTWATVPQVTHHDVADVTELEQLRKRFKERVAAAGGRLTLTAILVKVAASALRVFPKLNAAVDMTSHEVVFRDSVHLGVAVDTEHGLLVPVLRDVDRKSITRIAAELDDLAERARTRKLKPDEMRGGTFSISNLGGIGGTGFSPIVNWPEVAILGVSRGRQQPEWIDGQWQPRLMLPLSLSYDHRLVDGADAARFLRWVAEALEEPLLLALEG